MSGFAKKFECLEQRKFIGKLCTLYMYGMSGFAEKLNIQSCENSTKKLCTLYMYGMFELAKKLDVQCCENSTGNCVHYICTECLDLQRSEEHTSELQSRP